MNPLKQILLELQEISFLIARAFLSIFSKPRYYSETIKRMDVIGVGSLPIILLTGFFTGGVLTLQSYPTLAYYGGQSQTGQLVAFTLIRELGPVLCALMVAGRIGSAISAELGSMVVSQQIDAMRAFGTDPIRKLVLPRIVALVTMLPLLTVAADISGIIGGGVVASYIYNRLQRFCVFCTRRNHDRRYSWRHNQAAFLRFDHWQRRLLQRFEHDGRNSWCRTLNNKRRCSIFDSRDNC